MDWYYHAPGRGRLGPLSPDALRELYRTRGIEADTLVWREGLREWQPLERLSEELGLDGIKPEAHLPPPLPPGPAPGLAMPPVYATATPQGLPPGALRAEPPRKRMSGCLIALLVGAALAVPAIGILAAIAVPAYQGYVIRAKLATAVDQRARTVESAIAGAAAARGRCPASAQEANLPEDPTLEFGTVGTSCAFRLTVRGVSAQVDGRTVEFRATSTTNDAWDCTGGDLPPRFRAPACRPEPEGPVR